MGGSYSVAEENWHMFKFPTKFGTISNLVGTANVAQLLKLWDPKDEHWVERRRGKVGFEID